MRAGEVLAERAEVGVHVGIHRARLLRDGPDPQVVAPSQRELVQQLTHGEAQVLAVVNALGDAREGLRKPLVWRWVHRDPLPH